MPRLEGEKTRGIRLISDVIPFMEEALLCHPLFACLDARIGSINLVMEVNVSPLFLLFSKRWSNDSANGPTRRSNSIETLESQLWTRYPPAD